MRLEMAEEAATAESVYIFLVDYLAACDSRIGAKAR